MSKGTPEEREQTRILLERGAAVRREMQETIDRIDARLLAAKERRARRRRVLLRLVGRA